MIFKNLKSWAKINLSINVIKRLQNNYHSIESLITFVNLLAVTFATTFPLKIIGKKTRNPIILWGKTTFPFTPSFGQRC